MEGREKQVGIAVTSSLSHLQASVQLLGHRMTYSVLGESSGVSVIREETEHTQSQRVMKRQT